MRVRVPDNCLGLDVQGGKSYDAHNGVVDVDDGDAGQLADSWAGRHGFLSAGVTFRDPRGRECPTCGFGLFGFQKDCPRCKERRHEPVPA